MLSFKTSELKTRKKVTIDGHVFTVRRMGNIEQLEMSQYMGRLTRLSEIEGKRKLTDKENQEVDTISKSIADMFIGLFDDGGDQSKSKALLRSLSEEEITLYLEKIFEEKEAEDETS